MMGVVNAPQPIELPDIGGISMRPLCVTPTATALTQRFS
jgi:hypothetical protein